MRRLTVLFISISILATATIVMFEQTGGADDCCGGGRGSAHDSAGGSASGGAGASITAWTVRTSTGWVRPPFGATCSPWTTAASSREAAGWIDAGTIRVEHDGVVAALHVRDCEGVWQYTWIRQETPASLAGMAMRDLQSRLLVPPSPVLAPPDRSIVHLETWLAIRDPGVFQVTATTGSLSSTVTARVRSTTWELGDGTTVTCSGTGVVWRPADGDRPAPCGHTYRQVRDPNTVSVRITWEITWTSSTGAGGSFPDVTSVATSVPHPVQEIQSIGVAG